MFSYILGFEREELFNDQIIIFSCYTNLAFYARWVPYTSTWIGRSSFVQYFFLQMFTLHGYKNVPLVYCLLPDKRTSSYANALKKLVAKCKAVDLIQRTLS